jgi:hypothetical protein
MPGANVTGRPEPAGVQIECVTSKDNIESFKWPVLTIVPESSTKS